MEDEDSEEYEESDDEPLIMPWEPGFSWADMPPSLDEFGLPKEWKVSGVSVGVQHRTHDPSFAPITPE